MEILLLFHSKLAHNPGSDSRLYLSPLQKGWKSKTMDILILQVRYVISDISIDPYHNLKNWIFDDTCVPVLNTKQAKEKNKLVSPPPHTSHIFQLRVPKGLRNYLLRLGRRAPVVH